MIWGVTFLFIYVFGGCFTIGLLETDDSPSTFWVFFLWPLVLPAVLLILVLGVLGYAGHTAGSFINSHILKY
ncbi:MAG: hypothetical protein ACK4FG_02035 [Brevundimonas sp.]